MLQYNIMSVTVFWNPCSYVYLSREKIYTKFKVYFRHISPILPAKTTELLTFILYYENNHDKGTRNILRHVDPLLGNDREISN
jgi:hypothetical protein